MALFLWARIHAEERKVPEFSPNNFITNRKHSWILDFIPEYRFTQPEKL